MIHLVLNERAMILFSVSHGLQFPHLALSINDEDSKYIKIFVQLSYPLKKTIDSRRSWNCSIFSFLEHRTTQT